jgi:hypothetical protein
VTADEAARLASKVADALVQLLPTRGWNAEVADKVTQALGNGDTERAAALARRLRAAADQLRQVDPTARDQVEEQAFVQWRTLIERLLTDEPVLAGPAERAHETLLRAAGGVRGRPAGGQRTPAAPPAARLRRLLCESFDNVQAGADFGVIARIIIDQGTGAGTAIKSFPVPQAGRDVLLDIKADGMLVRGLYQQVVRVPPDDDSDPVRFQLRAGRPGPATVSVTAWVDGNFVGQSTVDVMVHEQLRDSHSKRFLSPGLSTEVDDGALSLLVRYEPLENRYRFQFIDSGDNPREVLASLSWPLGAQVEGLIGRLEAMKGNDAVARARLADEGAELWHGLVPEQVRRQFWERRDRITQLRILGDHDRVPWELMYPSDQGRDEGFLIDQFPVTRDIFDRPGLTRSLRRSPARFVLPPGSPDLAYEEVEYLRGLLGAGPAGETVISGFTALRELIKAGDFSLLHFACHNDFSPGEGSQITLEGAPFTLANLQSARNGMALQNSKPLVFINACRSAGLAPRYTELAGWAEGFLRAGAGGFIGSLWAVTDKSALTFATTLYELLTEGKLLGEAVMTARAMIARSPGDPTWLAYAVYGDPLARLTPLS